MATKTKAPAKKDVYGIVTEKILAALEEGTVPWRKPWTNNGYGGQANLNSKRPYTSINQLLLQLSEYDQPWWLTFNGAKQLGGHVAKGEKSTIVVFRKRIEVKDREADDPDAKKKVGMLRYYRVWNVEQCDGLEDAIPPEPETTFDPVAKADKIIKDYRAKYGGPAFKHGGMAVYGLPPADTVVVPHPSQFDGKADYYGTKFHEATHSTGIPDRLHRYELDARAADMGSESYSREELVAEIGSAMLCAIAGLTPNYESSAGYIEHWKSKLEDDPHLIVAAASAAQRSCDHIQGITHDDKEDSS